MRNCNVNTVSMQLQDSTVQYSIIVWYSMDGTEMWVYSAEYKVTPFCPRAVNVMGEWGTVKYSAVRYSTVQAVRYSTIQCSTVQYRDVSVQ